MDGDDETQSVDFTFDEDGTYSQDLIFHLLRNKRRRAVMFYLLFVKSEVSMRELSSQVSAWENGVDVENLSGSKRETTHISLYQTHLPTLNEHDIITYKKQRGKIIADDGIKVFKQYLIQDTDDSDEDIPPKPTDIDGTSWRATALKLLTPPVDTDIKWSRYYLSCAALGTVLISTSSLISNEPDIYMLLSTAIILVLLTTLSFVHVFYESNPEDIAKVERIILGKSYRK